MKQFDNLEARAEPFPLADMSLVPPAVQKLSFSSKLSTTSTDQHSDYNAHL